MGSRITSAAIIGATGVMLACTFDLGDVEANPIGGSDAGVMDASGDPDSFTFFDTGGSVDAATEHPGPTDGCWPVSDEQYCIEVGMHCGIASGVDDCGQPRDVDCGSCGADAHCESGSCVDYEYTWKTGDWSACSQACGGGARTRSVWCERDDGTTVPDAKCGGGKPASSDPCSCGADAHCENGSCIDYVYTWKTGAWSSCSEPCGGGTRTRSVWCERDDGTTVADAKCGGGKPASSDSCNTQSCCTPYCVSHDACGSDGCGGDCGSCASDRSCRNGYCVWQHGNDGSVSCHTLCAWGESQCVDTSVGSCGDKIDTECYCW